MLIDSNIVIYSIQPEYGFLRDLIAAEEPVVSAISLVEVLGFHGLSDEEKERLEEFFSTAIVVPLVHNEVLITRNARDFAWINGLTVLNPFEDDLSAG